MDVGGCQLDPLRRRFEGPAGAVRLSKAECALLAYLARNPGVPIPREELLREVWGYASTVRSRTVDTTLNRLRNKIELDPSAPQLLVTERGRGVVFRPPSRAAAPQQTALFGRQADLERIRSSVGGVASGVVTIVGPPGVGKTTLANHFAIEVDQPLVPARAARTGPDLASAVLRALGPPARRGPFEAVQLLVLDNLEQLEPDAIETIGTWSAEGPVLATSQRPLGLPGEVVLRLEPLSDEAALALLTDRLGTRHEGLERLVEQCDGLPLELELLATALPRFGVDTLAQVSVLTMRAPAGGWDLGQAMAWSWSLLSDELARVLRGLSVFSAEFDLQAAAAVLHQPPFEVLGWLAELHDRSLVSGSDGVFRLLTAVRDSARQRMTDPDERARFQEGRVAWCTQLWDDYVRYGPPRVQRHHLDLLQVIDQVDPQVAEPLVAALVEATPVPTWMELATIRRCAERAQSPDFFWAAYFDAARMAGDGDAIRTARAQLADGTEPCSLPRAFVLSQSDADSWTSEMVRAYASAPDHQRGYFVQRLSPVSERMSRLNELEQTAKARGWAYALASVRALLGTAAFEAGEPARAIELLERVPSRGELGAYRAFYLGLACLDVDDVAAATGHFRSGWEALPQAYAARCRALVAVIDLQAGRVDDVRTALHEDDLLDRFNVGRLSDLLRSVIEDVPIEPWTQVMTAWRAGSPPACDRRSFVAFAAHWLLSNTRAESLRSR